MGKRFEVSDMPALTPDMQKRICVLERQLEIALQTHCIGYNIFDLEGAFEKVRTFATVFYNCYYNFYSQYPACKANWRKASEVFAYQRVLTWIDNFHASREHFDSSRLQRIRRTISDHAERNAIPVASPTMQVGKQASIYAASGVDIASGSPLMMMVAAAARREQLQPVSSPKQSRISAQVDCRPAAAFILQYINSKAISLTDLANSAQTTDRTLRRLRKDGKIRRDVLKRLADTMGVSVEKLIG
jgi:DNA-binding Xre family transcriptional regulator